MPKFILSQIKKFVKHELTNTREILLLCIFLSMKYTNLFNPEIAMVLNFVFALRTLIVLILPNK